MKNIYLALVLLFITGLTTLYGQTIEKGYNDFPFTESGITVTKTLSGDFTSYGSTFTSCGITEKAGNIWTGQSGPATFRNDFDKSGVPFAMNDIEYNITGTNTTEAFTVTVSNGTPSIQVVSTNCPSDWSINGNILSCIGNGDNGAGIKIKIHSSEPYTWIQFYHNGGAGGSLFTMDFGSSFEALKPTVSTTTISSITNNSATGGGNITADGGASVTARGVCWNTSGTPTISDSYTTDGTGTGSYTSSITGLAHSTTYYVRAYATNANGTGYGSTTSFTTSSKTPATVTLSGLATTYNGSPQPVTATTTPAGLTVDITYNGSSTVPTNAGNYTIVATINDANYAGTTNGTLAISKKPLTITATGPSKTYGTSLAATTSTANFTATATGVGSETVTSVTLTPDAAGILATTPAGTAYTVTPSLATGTGGFLAGNYDITYNAYNGTVSKIFLTATADAKTKVYGAANPALTFSYSGFVDGDDSDDLTVQPTASTSVLSSSAAGTYTNAITLTGGSDEKYTFNYVPANFTITKADLHVVADNKDKCYDGYIFNETSYSVTYLGFVNGDNYKALGGTLSFSGTAMTAKDPGTYPIIPAGLSSNNYSLIYHTALLIINTPPTPTITGVNTACAGSTSYYSTEAAMTKYTWTVSEGGTIISGNGTKEIAVQWNSVGEKTVSVNCINTPGCSGSASKKVTVDPKPTASISGDAVICSGNEALITIALTGKAPWNITYSDGLNSKTVTSISQSPYSFKVSPAANTKTTYSVTSVSDIYNYPNSGSGTATITVNPDLKTTISSNADTLCYGSNDALLTASNMSTGITFQWQSSNDNVTWKNLNGTNGRVVAPGTSFETTYYRVITSVSGCENQLSNVTKITFLAPITYPTISSNQTVNPGTIPSKLESTPASGGSGSFTYQWQKKSGNLWVNVGNDALSYQPEAANQTTTYRLIATDKGKNRCGSVFSNEITITVKVKAATLPGTIAADQKIAPGSKPAPITSVTAGSGEGTISYTWESSTDNGTSWTTIPGENLAGYAPKAINQTTWFRRITVSTDNTIITTAASTPVKITTWGTGIDEKTQNALTAYAVGNTEIRIKGQVSAKAIAFLYDIQGKLIVTRNLEEGSLNTISTPNCKPGVYLLLVKDTDKAQSFKLMMKE